MGKPKQTHKTKFKP